MTKKEIQSLEWTKAWTTEYALFTVQLFSKEYTSVLEKIVGKGFDHVLFKYEKGLATVFRLQNEIRRVVQHYAKRAIDEENFCKDSIAKLLELQNEMEGYFDKPEKLLETSSLQRFMEIHQTTLAYFLVVLWLPDRLKNVDATEERKKELFDMCASARLATEHLYPDSEIYLKNVFALIAHKEGVEERLLLALLPDEFLTYTKTGTLPDKVVLQDRYDFCALVGTKEKDELFLGEDAKEIIAAAETIKVKTDNLVGKTGYPGKVIGKVKIIFTDKDAAEFPEGAILVTTMTRPDWVPAMKKAAAYVTDAGGVLCHAAIVARELKVPCLISTKHATQIFKDGDMVEVDAEKGVVKKIG